jgi:hypothetical protein
VSKKIVAAQLKAVRGKGKWAAGSKKKEEKKP